MLIGIMGRAQNGKSTVADAIQKKAASDYDMRSVLYDIGDLVRRHCIQQGLIPDKPRSSLTAAELQVLVAIGKDRRKGDPDFWIRRLEVGYNLLTFGDKTPVGIIPNVRYKNEAELVRRHGGVLIRVASLNEDGSPYLSPDRDPNHPSETTLLHEPADYYLTARRGQADLLRAFADACFTDALSKKERHQTK